MPQPEARFTEEEYLALERRSPEKHEYLDGELFAMAGASRRHNLITANLVRELGNALRDGPCEVYPSDMRVKVSATGLYTYPDVSVVCEEPRFQDDRLDTLLNPKVLVEVLSKSTADYDRGEKFEHYRALESVEEVIFVDSESLHVLAYRRRTADTWMLLESRDPEAELELPSVDIALAVAEIYAKVDFEPRLGPASGVDRPS